MSHLNSEDMVRKAENALGITQKEICHKELTVTTVGKSGRTSNHKKMSEMGDSQEIVWKPQ